MIQKVLDRSALKQMRDKLARNLRFALAASLSIAARETAEDIKAGLASKFTLRNQYVKGGIRFTGARVQDANMFSIAGGIKPAPEKGKPFLQKHDVGGDRDVDGKPPPGVTGPIAAIPLAARPSKGVWTKRSMWPKAMLKRDASAQEPGSPKKMPLHMTSLRGFLVDEHRARGSKTFVLTTKDWNQFLVTRTSSEKHAPLKFWYLFIHKARVKADFPFKHYEGTAWEHFRQTWPQKMKENL